jgi:predicted thioesterase
MDLDLPTVIVYLGRSVVGHRSGATAILPVSSPSDLELSWPVDRSLCTERGGVHLLSTPSLVLLMELTALQLLEPLLGENEATVGTEIRVSHLAPTPEGSTVRVRAKLVGREGRFFELELEAYDELDQVGAAEHKRAAIDTARYAARLQTKLEQLRQPGPASPQ